MYDKMLGPNVSIIRRFHCMSQPILRTKSLLCVLCSFNFCVNVIQSYILLLYIGNKGGVGISFFYGSVSMCFINCHLTSGNEKCGRFEIFLAHMYVVHACVKGRFEMFICT